jgi:flagellar basal body rod protein FlgG
VRLAGGRQLKTTSPAPLEVSRQGEVSQQGQPLGKLAVVAFSDPGTLAKRGNSYFRPADAAVAPAPASGVEVQQGKLEGSNVATAESAVRLIGVMRQFEMLHKAISIGADMNKKAVEEVARPGS